MEGQSLQTTITGLGLLIFFFLGSFLYFGKRENLPGTLLLAAIMMPIAQRLVIFGFNFYSMRLFLLIAWARLVLRKEFPTIKLTTIDWLMIAWAAAGTVAYTAKWLTAGAFFYRLGVMYDVLMIYFFFRITIHGFADLERVYRALALICIILMGFVIVELVTGRNLLSVFGGVPEYTDIRDGRLRCQGPFIHAIMLGTFSASLVPMFLSYCMQTNLYRRFVIIGVMAATAITVATASSGPALTLVSALLALAFWPLKHYLRTIRWALLLTVVALHLVMKAPVWALLDRVKVFGASTGYHRYLLFDAFIHHFDEWWLWGVKSTEYWGEGLHDVTNQFIRVAVDGGLISLILFVAIISLCFRNVGWALKWNERDGGAQKIVWGLGATLFAHVVSFLGVSYFDQILIVWFMLLALISSLPTLDMKKTQLSAGQHG